MQQAVKEKLKNGRQERKESKRTEHGKLRSGNNGGRQFHYNPRAYQGRERQAVKNAGRAVILRKSISL